MGRTRPRRATAPEPDEPARDPAELSRGVDAFRVRLPPFREGEPPFEGPLDLLLHLVKEHRVDLLDIPIARITESYLATLAALRELDIDLAGEFLHMAAQLMLMKSKLLLPRTEVAAEDAPEDAAGEDPRAELVRRLLEYQKYKAAAEELGRQDILERDVFARRVRVPLLVPDGPEGLADVSVIKLIEALDRALAKARPDLDREIFTERLTITDAIGRVAEILRARGRLLFEELLAGEGAEGTPPSRSYVIATFLALLEMAKLRLVRVFQAPADEAGPGAELVVEAQPSLSDGVAKVQEDYR